MPAGSTAVTDSQALCKDGNVAFAIVGTGKRNRPLFFFKARQIFGVFQEAEKVTATGGYLSMASLRQPIL